MELPTYFSDFIHNIRPTERQLIACREARQSMQGQLTNDDALSSIIVTMFLQGSYRRATMLRPEGEKKLDVDFVVVTRLDMDEYTPDQALHVFTDFLEEHYKGRYLFQGRSIGIDINQQVNLDLVITAAPSESQIGILQSESVKSIYTPDETKDWRLVESWISPEKRETAIARQKLKLALKESEWEVEPLFVPNREAQQWEPTNPLEVMRWTWEKNRKCNSHYVNVVKAIKWWRRHNNPESRKPTGYPVEHIVGYCIPDGTSSVAQGVVLSLEGITEIFSEDAKKNQSPFLEAHGVEGQNVFKRVSGVDFIDFYRRISEAAQLARAAYEADSTYESSKLWRDLFGNGFPPPSSPPPDDSNDSDPQGGYSPRDEKTTIGGGRFA